MRGSLYKHHGSYYLIVDKDEPNPNRKDGRTQEWIPLKTSNKKVAEELMIEKMQQIQTGQYIKQSDEALKTYLKEWLDYTKPPKVKPKTYDSYKWAIESISNVIGDIPLQELKAKNIDKYMRKKLNDGLSPNSVRNHYRALNIALKQAVAWEMIYKNPCATVKPPPKPHYEATVLTAANVSKILAYFFQTRFYLPILIAICTGMRRGEVCALKWDDVDMDNRIINVRNTLYIREGKRHIASVKTKKSRRLVPIPALLLAALKTAHVNYVANKLELGDLFKHDNFVWCWEDGSTPNPDDLTRHFTDGIAKLKLPAMRFHDLRHTCATLLLENGVDLKTVSEQLGHATQYFTSDVYAHVTDKMRDKVTEVLDKIVQK